METSSSRFDSEIYHKLAARSYFAAPVYLVLFFIVVLMTPIHSDYEAQVLIYAGLLALASSVRMGLAYSLLNDHSRLTNVWKGLFTSTIFLSSVVWGSFCFFIISQYGMSSTTFVLLFPTAGIIGATIVSLALVPRLLVSHVLFMTTPIITASALKWNEGGKAYVVLASIYLIYLLLQARLVSKKALADMENTVVIARQKTELELAWKEALDAAKVKSQFLALMSHEMRTPLNGILGASELLDDENISVTHREYTNSIRECSQRLLMMVDDVLQFSEIESGIFFLQPAPLDLVSLLQQSCRQFEKSIAVKGLQFKLDISPEVPPQLLGDAKRLEQILTHLIGNAVKFTPKGEVLVQMKCKVRNSNSRVIVISVKDSGVGIPLESLNTLFQPFAPADQTSTRSFDGAGLGLALCQRFAQVMGGGIEASSSVGEGSLFVLTLPMELPETETAKAEAALQEAAISSENSSFKNYRALVVEDNATNQKIIVAMLKKVGIESDVASNGFECLQALKQQKYNLILMDCRMPEMDGYEATRRIRQQQELAHLPIIAVTANALKGDREKCFEVGMTHYLTKPVKFPAFAETIRAALSAQTRKQA